MKDAMIHSRTWCKSQGRLGRYFSGSSCLYSYAVALLSLCFSMGTISTVGLIAAESAFAGTSTKSVADNGPRIVAPELDHGGAPNLLIESATNALIKEMLVGSKLPAEEQESYYLEAVEVIVAPFIDFERIARRVMAKHYRLASEQQREAFAKAFRQSMIDTYTKGISGYSDEEIKMLPFKGTRVSKKSRVERASVEMEVRTKEGTALNVVYQVYKNGSGHWRLENMILSGVNLGLTFRNQFNEALRAENGDLDKVIREWNISVPDEMEDQLKGKKDLALGQKS